MKQKLTVSCEGKPCYDIVLTIGFEELAGAALSVSAPERKICIVTDTNVAPLYAEQVKEAFSSAFAQVEVFEFPAGEENKTLANIQTLYAFLIEHHFDRKDMLAALGGGVVGDMTGLLQQPICAASILSRSRQPCSPRWIRASAERRA